MAGIFRLLIAAALLAMLAKVLEKTRRAKSTTPEPEWPSWAERQSGQSTTTQAASTGTPPPSAPTAPETAAVTPAWLPPVDGDCPDGYSVKAKESSGIYHVDGMVNYDRTKPNRCYKSAEAAEADGYRASKI